MPSPYFERQRADLGFDRQRVEINPHFDGGSARHVVFRDTDPRPPEPIPGLPDAAIPKRFVSAELGFSAELDVSAALAEKQLSDALEKLHAETERIRRLLPPPPYGYRWAPEIQASEPRGFDTHADLVLRVVFRLEPL